MDREDEQPIDRQRKSGGSMTVGLEEEGVISEFYKIGEKRLLIVKERAVYEMQLADTIDPDRTNKIIPNVQQRVFDSGSQSEIVQAILLQSDELLRDGFLRGLKLEVARSHVLDATGELLAMERVSDRVKNSEEEQINALIGKKLADGLIIPTLLDAHQDTKNFLNRSDHFMKEVQSITKLFFGSFGNWEKLHEKEKKVGLNDDEDEVFRRVIRYMRFIREARNASEHPHEKKKIIVNNFRILADGSISSPTFEFIHPKFSEPEIDLPVFMSATIDSLMNMYGAWLALLCSRKASFNGFPVAVANLPKERRKYARAGYHYALMTKDGLSPLG